MHISESSAKPVTIEQVGLTRRRSFAAVTCHPNLETGTGNVGHKNAGHEIDGPIGKAQN